MPQAEVADLVESARQHVLEEAAHEFMAAQSAGSLSAGLAFLVLDGDRLVVEIDDAGVGESDAKDIAGEVVEHGLLAVAPGGNVEDPARAPHRVGDDEVRAFSEQQRAELAAYQFGESLDRYQELTARRMPGGGVLGDAERLVMIVAVRQSPAPTAGLPVLRDGSAATDSRRLTPNDLDDLRTLIEPELAGRHLRLSWHTGIEGTVNVAANETRLGQGPLTRRFAMPTNRTGTALQAANTANVGTASCICEPSISAGMWGKRRMSSYALASGWVKQFGEQAQ